MKSIDIVDAIIRTLEQISVRGKDDCDRMAGCIKALEMIRDMASGETKIEDGEKNADPSVTKEEVNG